MNKKVIIAFVLGWALSLVFSPRSLIAVVKPSKAS